MTVKVYVTRMLSIVYKNILQVLFLRLIPVSDRTLDANLSTQRPPYISALIEVAMDENHIQQILCMSHSCKTSFSYTGILQIACPI